MADVTSIGGEQFPQSQPERETDSLYIYPDKRIVFKQEGLDLWGPHFREIGIDINSITTFDAFEQACQSVRESLGEMAAEKAKTKDNHEEWEAMSLILGGGDLDEARSLIDKADRKKNIRPVD